MTFVRRLAPVLAALISLSSLTARAADKVVIGDIDDLSGVSTATAELVKTGLLDSSRIPWTVSIHDLDLITQIVDRPAEFLLYLRRRRDPG